MAPHRSIVALKWAHQVPNPWPKRRLTGTKAKGIAYEKLIAKALPQAKQGFWIKFCDANGEGYCCPDFILKLNGQLVVLEAKLTDCPQAYTQLSQLYIPVLTHITGVAPKGVVIARNITRKSPPPASSISEALDCPSIQLVHWLGHTPLIP